MGHFLPAFSVCFVAMWLAVAQADTEGASRISTDHPEDFNSYPAVSFDLKAGQKVTYHSVEINNKSTLTCRQIILRDQLELCLLSLNPQRKKK